jgi:hypothetical protein
MSTLVLIITSALLAAQDRNVGAAAGAIIGAVEAARTGLRDLAFVYEGSLEWVAPEGLVDHHGPRKFDSASVEYLFQGAYWLM